MRSRRPRGRRSSPSSVVLAAAAGAATRPPPTTTTTTTPPTTTTTTEAPATTLVRSPACRSATTSVARPVVAIKIDNVDGKSTPQVGINQADVVYEIQVEGQITRLLSLFQSADAAPVGPVRSARGSEIGVLEELNHPLFTWHGANGILGPHGPGSRTVRAPVDRRHPAALLPRAQPAGAVQQLRAGHGRDPGHGARRVHRAHRADLRLRRTRARRRRRSPSRPARVDIRFPPPFGRGGGEAPVHYDWDGSAVAAVAERPPPRRRTTGAQVAVAERHRPVHRRPSTRARSTSPAPGSPPRRSWARARCGCFSQGTVTTGRWVKPDNMSPTQYLDQDGNPIKLTPGPHLDLDALRQRPARRSGEGRSPASAPAAGVAAQPRRRGHPADRPIGSARRCSTPCSAAAPSPDATCRRSLRRQRRAGHRGAQPGRRPTSGSSNPTVAPPTSIDHNLDTLGFRGPVDGGARPGRVVARLAARRRRRRPGRPALRLRRLARPARPRSRRDLADDAIVVVESDRPVDVPDGWEKMRERTYGGTVITFTAPAAGPSRRAARPPDATGADA